MEVLAARALKPSMRGELAFMKPSTQQVLCEEFFCLNGTNVVSGDDFSVDDLLDFSNDEFQQNPLAIGDDISEEEYEEGKDSDSVSSQDRSEEDSNSNSTTCVSGASAGGGVDSDSIFASELAVPDDDLAELEWVSHFVDDSPLEIPLLYPIRSEQTKSQTKKRPEPEPRKDTAKTPCFPFQIPVKARTTKSRKLNTLVLTFNPLISRPSSSSSASSSSTGGLISGSTVPDADWTGFVEPPAKKQKKKPEAQAQNGGSQFQRRCSHCQVQKTPQWRTGPLGPKTLCNACGVRFKSGRLFPEYRPACSPTFSSEIHSNSHRKVLEMRRRKDMAGPEPGLTQTHDFELLKLRVGN